MIHLFRKVRQKFLSENKVSKYLIYAVGEILLVVIGILIALQVNNWNQERLDKQKETIYLSGLKADLEECKIELDRVIKKTKRVDTTATNLLELMNDQDEMYNDPELDSTIVSVQGYTNFMTNESAIRELISSGNLNLIRDERIRSFIATWDSDLKPIRGWEGLSKKKVEQLINLLDEVGEHYNFEMRKTPLMNVNGRKEFLSTPKVRNTIHGISRYSLILNDLYNDKLVTIDSMLQIIGKVIEL